MIHLQVIITMIILVFIIGTFIEVRQKQNSTVFVSSLQKELENNMEKLTIAISNSEKEIKEITRNIHLIQAALISKQESNLKTEKQLTYLLDLGQSFLTQIETLQTKINDTPKKATQPIGQTRLKASQSQKKKDKEEVTKKPNEKEEVKI